MTDDGSGLISNWVDRKGGLAVTATTTARPTWGAASFNSVYPGVTFDGVANALTAASTGNLPVGSTAGNLAAVFSIPSAGIANGRIITMGSSGSNSRDLRQGSAGKPTVSDGSTTISSSAGTNFSPLILVGDWSGTTEDGWINGAALSGNPTTISSLNTGNSRVRLGANPAVSPSGFGAMVLVDALVTTLVSAADRQKLEGYFAWKYAFQSSLTAGHPYAGKAP